MLRRNMVTQSLSFLIFFPLTIKRVALAFAGMESVERIFKCICPLASAPIFRIKCTRHRYIQELPRECRDGAPLPKSWPPTGDMELSDLCLKYAPSLPNALDHVTLKLSHGAKVGVCGRTGCGKSSLFVALFRLIEPCGGSMRVGGVGIGNVQLDALRLQMSIIPQEPVMFGGSVRENVDPLRLYSDAAVQVIESLLCCVCCA